MRVVTFTTARDITVGDVPEPTTFEGQVKIQVGYSGICGTDRSRLSVISDGEEPAQEVHELVALLDLGPVSTVVEHVELGARDELGQA